MVVEERNENERERSHALLLVTGSGRAGEIQGSWEDHSLL